jgi:phosphoribosyl 1,2-cyclic phosphate phosphodiesterase
MFEKGALSGARLLFLPSVAAGCFAHDMDVIFLGTGTSQGVPMIACRCAVCSSADPRNQRTRASIHVVMDGLHVQVDASPEFRLQCLREKIDQLDVFILTHGHADHIVGMDDLRRFCDLHGGTALTVFTTEEGMGRMLAMYPYAMGERPIATGYAAFQPAGMPSRMEFAQGTIESTLLPHGGVNTLGLVFTERSSGKKLPITPTASGCPGRPLPWRGGLMRWSWTGCDPCRIPRT